MAREYSVWNVAIATLQFWTADLKAHMLSSAIEHIQNAFFYSASMHLLHQQSDEILFGHFVTTLNAAFESKLTLEDEGYDSGSKNFNIPTPLRRTTKIHHISSVKNPSFDPDPVTPYNTGTREPHHRLVHRCLTFSSSEEDDDDTPTDEFPSPDQIPPVQCHQVVFQQLSSPSNMSITLGKKRDMEEDFQIVLLEDEHWNTDKIPDRHLCIHEHSLPYRLCLYPCPYVNYQTSSYYDTLDLREFEDLMTMSSNEDIPSLKDIGY